jgi:hypothetical protein
VYPPVALISDVPICSVLQRAKAAGSQVGGNAGLQFNW